MTSRVSENRPSILIIEDSRTDRARFRLLLASNASDYEFAWTWKQGNGCGVFNRFEKEVSREVREISLPSPWGRRESLPGVSLYHLLDSSENVREWLCSFNLILLDLAWTNQAECVMQDFQLLTRQQGKECGKAKHTTANTILRRFIDSVEGIALLEWLNKNVWRLDEPHEPAVWVTSAYIPMTAVGMREFLQVRYNLHGGLHLFHKWIDEAALVSDLRSFLDASKKNKEDHT